MRQPRCLFFVFFLFSFLFASAILADTYTVTNCADSGTGSLRQAITDANAHGAGDLIVFDIQLSNTSYSTGTSSPGLVTNEAGSNKWFRIIVGSILPSVNVDYVDISGSTQTREAANTLGPSVEVGGQAATVLRSTPATARSRAWSSINFSAGRA